MPFGSLDDLTRYEAIPGYTARFVHSDSMTIAYWEIKADHRVPRHQHEHEMVINCIAGTFEVTIDGETRTLGPGGIAIVPSNALHSAYAVTDCLVIDVFSPVRADYKALMG